MKPPYSVTPAILSLPASISEKLGVIKAHHLQVFRAERRKANRIKMIQSTLEIGGNTLSIDQVTALINNNRLLAPQNDIIEVKNAIAVYDELQRFKSSSMSSFLKAHALLLKGLVRQPGKFRSAGAGIVEGSKLTHRAPKAGLVSKEILVDLQDVLKK